MGVDVTVSGRKRAIAARPVFNAASERAIKTAEKGGMRRSYWDWQEQIEANNRRLSLYPATNLLMV